MGIQIEANLVLTINSISPGKIAMGCISGGKHSFKSLIGLSDTGFVNPVAVEANPIRGWLNDSAYLNVIHKSVDLNAIFSKMSHNGYGGTLILVPNEDDSWRDSVQNPINYEYSDLRGFSYSELSTNMRLFAN